jgi:hypothetical protein
MKLLQEVQGLAERPNHNPPRAFVLQQFLPKMRTPGRKRTLTVIVKDPPDIPQPVKIVFLSQGL